MKGVFNMNKIGFQNFRRFKNFKPLEYKGVTFLVGRNNSGKSTMVKALLLINEFFKSGKVNTFSFGNSILEDANIVTYERAKNRSAKENFIKFFYECENFEVEILISGQDEKTMADVHLFLIRDIDEGIEFLIEPQLSTITISKKQRAIPKNGLNDVLSKLNYEIENLKITNEKSKLVKSNIESMKLIDRLNSLIKKRDVLLNSVNLDDDENGNIVNEPLLNYNKNSEFTVSTFFSVGMNFIEIYLFIISEASFLHDQGFKEIQEGEEEPQNFQNYRGFHLNKSKIENSIKKFITLITNSTIIYLGASPEKQSALFAVRDKNNALAQAIHEFKQLGIDKAISSEAFLFTKKWMGDDKFDIGDKIEILMHAGEAYEVKITKRNIKIHLADKGTGSIQAMLLIIRLASIIHKSKKSENNTTVIIEEPELNLHPALQSQLADLFLEVHEKYKINCIIETHSEYVIRRSQTLVKMNEFEVKPNENPFCVYYFEETEGYYNLDFDSNGKFLKKFGSGFFNVADDHAMDLYNLNKNA